MTHAQKLDRSLQALVKRPTSESGISHADEWCWTVARRAYEIAQRVCACRDLEQKQIKQIPWKHLPRGPQSQWYVSAKFIMATLDELE